MESKNQGREEDRPWTVKIALAPTTLGTQADRSSDVRCACRDTPASSGTGGIWLFVADSCHMEAYQVLTSAQGITTLQLAWSAAAQATSPILAGGVLYAATSYALLALDPHTGHTLWSSALPTAGGGISSIHWESPIVVGGRLYCTDENQRLTMYQLQR